MVTGTQAQRATLLCPQPVVPCRLSIHRAVCPWVSCRLRRSHVGCPHNGMSVDPSWTPQVACISVHTTALTSHFPAWSIHRPGPDSHFPHNQDLIPRLSGPRPLAGSAPLCPPDYWRPAPNFTEGSEVEWAVQCVEVHSVHLQEVSTNFLPPEPVHVRDQGVDCCVTIVHHKLMQ